LNQVKDNEVKDNGKAKQQTQNLNSRFTIKNYGQKRDDSQKRQASKKIPDHTPSFVKRYPTKKTVFAHHQEPEKHKIPRFQTNKQIPNLCPSFGKHDLEIKKEKDRIIPVISQKYGMTQEQLQNKIRQKTQAAKFLEVFFEFCDFRLNRLMLLFLNNCT
jgi:hypothetical protein